MIREQARSTSATDEFQAVHTADEHSEIPGHDLSTPPVLGDVFFLATHVFATSHLS